MTIYPVIMKIRKEYESPALIESILLDEKVLAGSADVEYTFNAPFEDEITF